MEIRPMGDGIHHFQPTLKRSCCAVKHAERSDTLVGRLVPSAPPPPPHQTPSPMNLCVCVCARARLVCDVRKGAPWLMLSFTHAPNTRRPLSTETHEPPGTTLKWSALNMAHEVRSKRTATLRRIKTVYMQFQLYTQPSPETSPARARAHINNTKHI